MSIAAIGSVASTRSSEPLVIDSSAFRAFNTGKGQSRPERSSVVLVMGLSIVMLSGGEKRRVGGIKNEHLRKS